MVKLKPGTNVDAFTAQVRALVPQESIAFQRAAAVTAEVVDATEPEVIALEAFAALAALLGLVVVSQAISRRLQIDARHNPTLAALGMTRSQRAAQSMVKSMLAVIVGAALAVVIAVAASGLGPVGAVRVAEVHPGIRFDWTLLLAGGVSVIAMGALLSVIPAWRSSRLLAGETVARRSRVAGVVAAGAGHWPLSSGSVSGSKRGRAGHLSRCGPRCSRPPPRSPSSCRWPCSRPASITCSPLLVSTVPPGTGRSSWTTSTAPTARTATDPAQAAAAQQKFVEVASRSGSVSAWSRLDVGEVRSGDIAIPAIGLSVGHPGVQVTIDGGRAPASVDEVALGQTTMDRLHTHIGASVLLVGPRNGTTRNRAGRGASRAARPGPLSRVGQGRPGRGCPSHRGRVEAVQLRLPENRIHLPLGARQVARHADRRLSTG